MDLLEREQHLAQLDEHLRDVVAGHGQMVFVCGEAGVGKTSLVDAFCRGVDNAARILWKSCDALSTPGPLGSLRDIAPVLGLRVEAESFTAEDRDWLFRATLDALAAHSSATIMVGEDAHWADGATFELLRFLARRIQHERILVIVTYRDDELGAQHPLRVLLGDMATNAAVRRLPVQPLSADAVAHLAQGSGRDAAALHLLTGGNPFYLSEVLATADDAIPASVEDAILARAARLTPEARAMLEVAAVIATRIYPDLLARLAGPPDAHFDTCVACGLLRITGDDLAFRHEITRKAIMAAIPPPRRRLLHARVLAALLERPAQERDLALLAHHAEGAGDGDAALTFALAAAEQASTLFAHREAAAQYARALRFGSHLPAAERARLLEAEAHTRYLCDEADTALTLREEVLALWHELGETRKVGESQRWLSRLHWVKGQGDQAEAAGKAAVEILETLPPGPELAMAYSNRAQLRMLANDLPGTLHWGNLALALAERFGETETLLHTLTNLGTAQQYAGLDYGEAALQRSLHLALQGGYTDHACRALTNLAWCAMVRMHLGEAERRLATAITYATDHDLDTYLRYLQATRVELLVRQGAWDPALATAEHLLRHLAGSHNARIVALTALGQIQVRRGHPDARSTLDQALELAVRTGEPLRIVPVRLARAEAALLRDDHAGVAAELAPVREGVFAQGERWQRGQVAWLLRQIGDTSTPCHDLAPPYALLMAGQFAAAADAWQGLGCPYEAACALAASRDPALLRAAAPPLEALAARPMLAVVIRRLRDLGAGNLPVLRQGPRSATRANPAGLTRREAEVLSLVATGLRTAEIADRLFLTPKTVGHHITAIYAKLGVTNRAEATRAAAKLGLRAP